jgi:hypothetical protein
MGRGFRSGAIRLAAVLGLLLAPSICSATSCLGPITVCSAFEGSAVVFRGRIVSISRIESPDSGHTVMYPDGSSAKLFTMSGGGLSYRIVFDVLETFRGDLGAQITIDAGQWTPTFERGREYLIFANSSKATGELVTSVCSRDHEAKDDSNDEDIAWLRAYPKSDGSGFISGHIYMRGAGQMMVPDDEMPAATAIKITGNGVDKTMAPVHEVYRADKLPAGSYTIAAVVPAGVTTDKPREITLAPKSCAEVDWMLYNDSHIRGMVTDANGRPLAKAGVALVEPYDDGVSFAVLAQTATDLDGRYEFSKVAVGDYSIALHPFGPNNNSPYLPVFYPASQTLSGSKLLHVERAATLEGINLTELDALKPVTVNVSVMGERMALP